MSVLNTKSNFPDIHVLVNLNGGELCLEDSHGNPCPAGSVINAYNIAKDEWFLHGYYYDPIICRGINAKENCNKAEFKKAYSAYRKWCRNISKEQENRSPEFTEI